MNNEMYHMIADKEEMRWFFDHCIFKPTLHEMYTLEFVCRHKKLTEEEKQTLGLTRREAEFLATQTVRLSRIKDGEKEEDLSWDFDKFYRHVSRFECNIDGYTTRTGERLPQKCLVVLCYVNPGNNLKLTEELIKKIDASRTAILTAVSNGKTYDDVKTQYQVFSNLESSIKHLQANCKGSVYWMDFDVDVPAWFKEDYVALNPERDNNINGPYYYNTLKKRLRDRFGIGNFVIIDTSGGYHILVRTCSIRSNPHDFCKEVKAIYEHGIADGHPEYVDDKGNVKFECDINDSQIPGLPLPGTFQYGRPVTVLNKEDFE